MNTYLLYLRFRLLRGELTAGEYAQEVSLARERIAGDRRAALARIRRGVGRERGLARCHCRRADARYALTNPTGANLPLSAMIEGTFHHRSSTVAYTLRKSSAYPVLPSPPSRSSDGASP